MSLDLFDGANRLIGMIEGIAAKVGRGASAAQAAMEFAKSVQDRQREKDAKIAEFMGHQDVAARIRGTTQAPPR